jgi:hypothetical protein
VNIYYYRYLFKALLLGKFKWEDESDNEKKRHLFSKLQAVQFDTTKIEDHFKFSEVVSYKGTWYPNDKGYNEMTANGIGIVYFKDGSKYIGHIKHGEIKGYGKLFRAKTGSGIDQGFKEGMFENGVL